MNHPIIIIALISVLVILFFLFKYRKFLYEKIEPFRRRRRGRRSGEGGRRGRRGRRRRKRRCKRTCPPKCVFEVDPSKKGSRYQRCKTKGKGLCKRTKKDCKKTWDKDFIDATQGATERLLVDSYYSEKYGISDSGNYEDPDENLSKLESIRNQLQAQKSIMKKLLKHRRFNRNRRRKKKKIKHCHKMLNNLLKVNGHLLTAHTKLLTLNPKDNTEITAQDYLDLKKINHKVKHATKLLTSESRCGYSFESDPNMKQLIDSFHLHGEATLKSFWYSFSNSKKEHIKRMESGDGTIISSAKKIGSRSLRSVKKFFEKFQNRNEQQQQYLTYKKGIDHYISEISPIIENFNNVFKEEIDEYGDDSDSDDDDSENLIEGFDNPQKSDVVEGFETQSLTQVRDVLQNYNDLYQGGIFLGLDPNDATSNTYNTLNNSKLAPYAGDQYLVTGNISDSNVSDDEIPYNVRQGAISSRLPYTMNQCHQKWNDLDTNTTETDYLNRINWTGYAQSISQQEKNYNLDQAVVNMTKGYGGFWDTTKNTWIPKETTDNASNCNGIYDGEVVDNTVGSSNLKDYIGESQKIELQRKQLLAARANIYSNMTGADSKRKISEPKAYCPYVVDQDTKAITEWTRAKDSLQPNVCQSFDSFSKDKTNYPLVGSMKPGKIIGMNDRGTDQWMENIGALENSRSVYNNLLNNSQSTRYKIKVDGNIVNNTIDSMNTDLMRLSGNSIQKSLQDRDWSKSTYKWDKNTNNREHQNYLYIKKRYFPMLRMIKLNNSDIYHFNISYTENDSNQKSEQNISFISEDKSMISNINIRAKNKELSGVVRVFRNAYQYQDFITDNTNNKINLSSVKGLQTRMLGLQYNILSWELDELVNNGVDLYIVCAQPSISHDLYNNENGILCFHNDSQFGKCYYSKKNDNPSLYYDMTIVANRTLGGYLILNKNTKKYLAFGVNYRDTSNWSFQSNVTMNSNNISYDNNKDARTPVLYYVSMDDIDFSKQGTTDYTNLLRDLTWMIKRTKDNRYSITHFSGSVLWYTSTTFQVKFLSDSSQPSSVSNPLYQMLGYIGCTSSNSTSEESSQSFCDSHLEECYNKHFYIIPKPPVDVTSDFTIRDYRDENSSDYTVWYNQLRNQCSRRGSNLTSNNTWYRTINESFPIPYSNFDEESGAVSSNMSKIEKKNSNIYDMYNQDNQVITSLKGGGGWNCSKSNYCHVERDTLEKDKDTGRPNPVYQRKEGVLNSQDESNPIELNYIDKNGNTQTQIFNQPINRYKYRCVRNRFGTFKIYNNENTIGFTENLDPNIKTGKDDPDNKTKDKTVAVLVFSYNEQYQEGRDFGIALNGNYIWFKDTTDLSQIGFCQKNEIELLKNYIVLKNSDSPSLAKHGKKVMLQWYDRLRFQTIGLTDLDPFKVYSYSNIYAGTKEFNSVFLPKDSDS